MNPALGKVHFWITVVCLTLIFVMMHVAGYAGQQRRLYDPFQYTFLKHLAPLNRWTSWLASPATASVSMMLVGSAFQGLVLAFNLDGALGEALVLTLAMVAAITHFTVNTFLITMVVHLKRNEPLRLAAFLSNFGWVGTTYAASALIAGLLYLTFKATGIGAIWVRWQAQVTSYGSVWPSSRASGTREPVCGELP